MPLIHIALMPSFVSRSISLTKPSAHGDQVKTFTYPKLIFIKCYLEFTQLTLPCSGGHVNNWKTSNSMVKTGWLRAPAFSYTDHGLAACMQRRLSRRFLGLSGQWRFHYFDHPCTGAGTITAPWRLGPG